MPRKSVANRKLPEPMSLSWPGGHVVDGRVWIVGSGDLVDRQ